LIKGFPTTTTTTTTTTKQNVDPAVYYVYSRVKLIIMSRLELLCLGRLAPASELTGGHTKPF
jgi:hypothetical protein